LADHIKAGQINTTHITSDSSLAIKASQILLDGTTYFVNSWQKAGDVTKIDGGQISTGTVTANQIAAHAITTDKLTVGLSNFVPDGDFELGDATKEWTYEGTSGYTVVTSPVHGGTYALKVPAGAGVLSKAFFPILPGERLLARAWAESPSGGTAYLKIYWYDINKTYLSAAIIGSTSSTTWTELKNSAPSPSAAYYWKPYLQAVTYDCYFDDVFVRKQIFTDDIDDNAIVASKIGANQVSTDQLQLSRLDQNTGEPTKEGALYYWTPDDTLRFIGQTGEKGFIPRYPITEVNVPPENMLPNPCLDADIDGNGVPDFWEPQTNYANISLYSSDSLRGGKCAKVQATSSVNNAWAGYNSPYITVKPGKQYWVGVSGKILTSGGTQYFGVTVNQYRRDKSASATNQKVYTWSASSNWIAKGTIYTADSDTYYVRVKPFYRIDYSTTGVGLFDDIVFSELRAYFNPQANYIFPPITEADRFYDGIAQYYIHTTYVKVERTVQVTAFREHQYSAGNVDSQYIGIYADNGSGYPGKLLWSYGPFTWTSGWFQYAISPSLTLEPGIYWLAHYNANSITNNIYRAVRFLPLYLTSNAEMVGGWTVYSTSGLTDPFPSGGTIRQSVQEVGLVVS